MVDNHAALGQDFLQIAKRNGISEIEVNRVRDNWLRKLATFEDITFATLNF